MAITNKTLNISGMNCVSCAQSIEKALKAVPGVQTAEVNYVNAEAVVSYDTDKCTVDDLYAEVKRTGYTADLVSGISGSKRKRGLQALGKLVLVSSILSLPIIIGSMVPFAPVWLKNPWLHLLLATPVQFYVGGLFYRSAWRAFWYYRANMNTLIALGTSVAYFYSIFVLLFKKMLVAVDIEPHTYFESSVVIITFILLGQWLELKAKGRASYAIQMLMNLQPKIATIRDRASKLERWHSIPLEKVQVDDIVLAKPGDVIPVDGMVIHGDSLVDQSMVTGESSPVEKSINTIVISGTRNISGALQVRVTKIGSETFLANIIALVKRAQGSKAPIQRLVDYISSWFVPIVIIVALLTFLIWFNFGPSPSFVYAMVTLVSVLIITCPCALGLAAPTAIMVGMERAALEHFLIKDAQTLEVAGKLDCIVLDKTGTLTRGRPELVNLAFLSDTALYANQLGLREKTKEQLQKYILSLLVSLENLSRHPISEAVTRRFSKQFNLLVVEQFKDIQGFGISGRVDDHQVLIGNRALFEREGISIAPELASYAKSWSGAAHTVSFIGIDGIVVSIFGVVDPLRKEARDMVKKLRVMGIEIVMLTGDSEQVASAVAKALGISSYYANVLPQQKEEYIRKLQDKGYRVGMVGDGINDAPALAAADVGMAMGEGTDIAIETAGVALLKNDIALVPKVIQLSRATIRIIWQNLAWAFGYNILLIPVAAGIFYPLIGLLLNPMLAGAAMAISSLSVILNALRLRYVKI